LFTDFKIKSKRGEEWGGKEKKRKTGKTKRKMG
jgi:hypothetical protein